MVSPFFKIVFYLKNIKLIFFYSFNMMILKIKKKYLKASYTEVLLGFILIVIVFIFWIILK